MRLRLVWPVALAVLCSGVARPSASTLSARLVGTWRVIQHQERKSPQEDWKDDYGPHPAGYLMYDAAGRMAVQIARVPRPPFTAKDGEPTPAAARAAIDGYVAYFGTFRVDERTGVVTHHVESSLWPDYVGTDQHRPAVLQGDRLTLSDGKTWRVVWERVR